MDEVTHTVSTDLAHVTVSGEPTLGALEAHDAGAFVEVLDKHDAVLRRERFETLPVTIGNSYQCDYVIDSESARDERVVLTRNDTGALIVNSVSTAAKFWAPGGMTSAWAINPDQAFLVAGERIRVRTRDYTPSRSRLVQTPLAWLGGWTTLVAVALAIAITALQTWVADTEGERATKYVTGALAMVGLVSLWAGAWAVVSRLTGRSTHFLAHLSLACLALVAIATIDFVFDSAAYALNFSTLYQYGYLLAAACVGVLVWCHTRYIVRTSVASAATTGFVFAIAIASMQAITYYNLRGNLEAGQTMTEMRPPSWQWVSSATLDDFFSGSAHLEKRAEESKPEKPEGFDFGSYGE